MISSLASLFLGTIFDGAAAVATPCSGRQCDPRFSRLVTRTQALFLTGYGGPFNPDVVNRMVSAWLTQAGLKRKGCCHIPRHACATHRLEIGADIRFIKQLLGHKKLDTTAIYTEVSIKQLQEVHATLPSVGPTAK